jgi:hypothetical protein
MLAKKKAKTAMVPGGSDEEFAAKAADHGICCYLQRFFPCSVVEQVVIKPFS